MIERLGVDVDGVIIDRDAHIDSQASFFGNNYLETPPTKGSFDALRMLNSEVFNNEVYLICKASTSIRRKTLNWLRHYDFNGATGISENKIYFCKQNDFKALVCSELMITHFIDDRTKVLGFLKSTVKNLYLLNPNPGLMKNLDEGLNFWWMKNWNDLAEHLKQH